tara:strand:+ start:8987 stop:10225 length:1239 start_codon:yes stop_codon:yes gene_type:complete
MLIFKLAWRNIWRNKKRSLVTLGLCTICTVFLIWFEAFNDGSHQKMIRDVVEMYPGYIQIQEKGYFDRPSYDHLLTNISTIKQQLKAIDGIHAKSVRFEAPSLFSSKDVSYGGLLIGIEPENEAKISRLKKALVTGRFITSSDTNGVYMGVDLAKKLHVNLGDSFVFMSSAMDRSMAADTLTVKGLFESNLFDSDIQFVFVNKSFMDDIFLVNNMASYLVVKPTNTAESLVLAETLTRLFNDTTIEVLSWRHLLSSFVQFVEMDEAMGRMAIVIVVLVVFFVIMIFNFISIYNRTKEVGMMRAMGTSDWQIIGVLSLESLIMTMMSIIFGVCGGSWLAIYFETNPLEIKLSEDVLEMYHQFGMLDFSIPTRFSLDAIIFGVIIIIVINVLAIIFPIWKTLQLKPRQALQGNS